MGLRQALYGMMNLALILLKVLMFYFLYRFTFKLETQARGRAERCRQVKSQAREQRLVREAEERESLSAKAFQSIHNSLRRNFSLL